MCRRRSGSLGQLGLGPVSRDHSAPLQPVRGVRVGSCGISWWLIAACGAGMAQSGSCRVTMHWQGRDGCPAYERAVLALCRNTISPSSSGRDRNGFRQFSSRGRAWARRSCRRSAPPRLVQPVHGPPWSSWRQWATVLSAEVAHRSGHPPSRAGHMTAVFNVSRSARIAQGCPAGPVAARGLGLCQTVLAADIANSSPGRPQDRGSAQGWVLRWTPSWRVEAAPRPGGQVRRGGAACAAYRSPPRPGREDIDRCDDLQAAVPAMAATRVPSDSVSLERVPRRPAGQGVEHRAARHPAVGVNPARLRPGKATSFGTGSAISAGLTGGPPSGFQADKLSVGVRSSPGPQLGRVRRRQDVSVLLGIGERLAARPRLCRGLPSH